MRIHTDRAAQALFSTIVIALVNASATSLVGAIYPKPYTSSYYQSPVRGNPDDLLVIGGADFAPTAQAYYRRTNIVTPPGSTVSPPTALEGFADVVKVSAQGDAITIHLPAVMALNEGYVLWLRNSPTDLDWSAGIRINNARPLWITPEVAYATAVLAELPRELKVVGRNLQPRPGVSTKVKLTKPGKTYTLTAQSNTTYPALDHYVAVVTLPNPLQTGQYDVSVSRDGSIWYTIGGQKLTVSADPPVPGPNDYVYPNCTPDDQVDDAACIQAAINTAAQQGGKTVFLGQGHWRLDSPPDNDYGIIVPAGVKLQGGGPLPAVVETTVNWSWTSTADSNCDPSLCCYAPCACEPGQGTEPIPRARTAFTLLGNNVVRELHFADLVDYNSAPRLACLSDYEKLSRNFLLLGHRAVAGQNEVVDNVTITLNDFTGMVTAIGDGGNPIKHLYITQNTIQGFLFGIALATQFTPKEINSNLQDSVIAFNWFTPSPYNDPPIQGPIATAIGASRRVDFSNNTADGHINDGWRAAYFWHMRNSQEMTLVSGNMATCTGDKSGDGEFLAIDLNGNRPGWKRIAQSIVGTPTATTLQVTPAWVEDPVQLPNYYTQSNGYWIQIVKGRGVGQARGVVSYVPSGPPGQWTITVSPGWDVTPDATSKVTLIRQTWQAYLVANTVDTRGCLKSNPTTDRSGVIELFGPLTDSTIEANSMFESDGIRLQTQYFDSVADSAEGDGASWHYFSEIRGNAIHDEYSFNRCWTGFTSPYKSACCTGGSACQGPGPLTCPLPDCSPSGCTPASCTTPVWPQGPCCVNGSWSGISIVYGTLSQDAAADYPVGSLGVSISHNTIEHADGVRGGMISIADMSFLPPSGARWVSSAALAHNDISDVTRRDAACQLLPLPSTCAGSLDFDRGVGIQIRGQDECSAQGCVQQGTCSSTTYDTALYRNTIDEVGEPVLDAGKNTVFWTTGASPIYDCAPEIECCQSGAGCAASTSGCWILDTLTQECKRGSDPEDRLSCPPGQTVHQIQCPCTGTGCSSSQDRHLECM